MLKVRYYYLAAAIIGSFIGYGFTHSQAAIAVIDTQNIAQQAKTYAESAKLVTQTAQQITLMAKELASFPASVINSYNQSIKDSTTNLQNTITKTTVTLATTATEAQIKSYWENKFPQLNANDNWAISEQNNVILRRNMREQLSQDNQAMLIAYKEMMTELDKNQEMLNEMLKKNADIEGNKQGQQLANQIAGIKANIDRINLNMQALQGKHRIESAQARLTAEENEQIIVEAKARAEEEELAKSKANSNKTMHMPLPFEKYAF